MRKSVGKEESTYKIQCVYIRAHEGCSKSNASALLSLADIESIPVEYEASCQ